MLDMGFSEDIMKIVENLPPKRQTILFSATMPPKIAELARQIMHDPVEVSIAVSKPAEKIDQSVYICKEGDKTAIIKHLFKEKAPERVILFASSKQKVKDLNISLQRAGYNVAAMHSDLEQKQRDEVMLDFKARRIDILVATDIVARGIDIDDITLVINYDAPHDAEDYVHRIGRTARAGREGRAITLVGEHDRTALASIENLLNEKVPRAALPEGMSAPVSDSMTRRKKNGTRKHSHPNKHYNNHRNGHNHTTSKSTKTNSRGKKGHPQQGKDTP